MDDRELTPTPRPLVVRLIGAAVAALLVAAAAVPAAGCLVSGLRF